MLKLFNTLSGKVETFHPINTGKIGIYMCGMTVQDRPHLGHIRSFIIGDVLRRYLEYTGNSVEYVQNFTDIDDKIIERSRKNNIDWRDIGWKYTNEYLNASDMLNIKRATHYPRATQFIEEIIELVQILIEKGFAYVTEDKSIYYDVSKFPGYGKLSGKNISELKQGARVQPDPYKRNPFDFAIWKAQKPGEPYWHSPWGRGRPGWHIECSAMSTHFLGQPFDIHMGGQDLIFPHHEDEIAQSEAAFDKQFVNYWVHIGFMNIKGEKMSKSTGLFFAISDILKEFEPDAVRLFILQKHYRSPIDYNRELLMQSSQALTKLNHILQQTDTNTRTLNKSLLQKFEEAMDNDLNTPTVIGQIFSYIRENPQDTATPYVILKALGFRGKSISHGNLLDKVMRIIIETRQQLREQRHFELSDAIRDKLSSIGIAIEDTKNGSNWKA